MTRRDSRGAGDWVLRARGIEKVYGGVRALRGVDFDVRAGEVHAVVGENGAGKSTLMKVLAGLEVPDQGTLHLRGRIVRFREPREALVQGIHLVHQELMPFPDLTVAENLFAGQEPTQRFPGWVDRSRMFGEAAELLKRVGVDVNPRRRMGDLTVAQMQGVEIARGLAHAVDVLVLDEPTSALSHREADRLFELVADLRERGMALVYITHKMEEVFRLADRVMVLRDGERVMSALCREVRPDELVRQMVGRVIQRVHRERSPVAGEVLLDARQLSCSGVEGVDLTVRAGEVVGLAGLVGAGRTELASALYGLQRTTGGRICFRGLEVKGWQPADALAAGMAMVTEDRQGTGLISTMSVQENLTLSSLAACVSRGRLDGAKERGLARQWTEALRIKVADLGQAIGQLSGGNQQKVVLGRALMTLPSLLILDEPTRGIDVGAKEEIYALIGRWRDQGLGVLVISSELPELMRLCHRIVVMCEGRITTEMPAAEATEELLLAHAMPRSERRGGFRSG